mmetsp:Transcript_22046/g.39087  ORF Transcript_22046/g.39087 Transcript_22046/m.39087 type:complete len:392 (-) Transcript_22046:57-1232(-)|eukprot:CAMPEP_0197521026 /NCGR_PEP_ID=MMETSP1318-20131121/6308_1 /TAXON_ID=552666 /ORGANISM="Partenskyella glossopodia, Strain RCC365" /LENGTH=391 /DNA_ID=CAMNT_0043072831 /DNA_START=126 /DNA_END=1301 /DNA_ORIENTATION=-
MLREIEFRKKVVIVGLAAIAFGSQSNVCQAADFCNIPRVNGKYLSYWEAENVVLKSPVILTNLTDDWSALSKWAEEEFTQNYGNLTLPRYTPTGTNYFTDTEYQALGNVVEISANNHFIIYDTGETAGIMNAIRKDYNLPNILQSSSWTTILSFGGAAKGATFQRHQVAWLATIFGHKHWWLAPKTAPEPPDPQCFTNQGDPRDEGFWKSQQVQYCKVYPGEILWVPEMWWHATCNGDPYTVGLGGQGYIPYAHNLIGENGALSPPHYAGLRGDIDQLQKYVEEGLDLCNMDYPSPLHFSASNDYVEVIEKMVEVVGPCVLESRHRGVPSIADAAMNSANMRVVKYMFQKHGILPAPHVVQEIVERYAQHDHPPKGLDWVLEKLGQAQKGQ